MAKLLLLVVVVVVLAYDRNYSTNYNSEIQKFKVYLFNSYKQTIDHLKKHNKRVGERRMKIQKFSLLNLICECAVWRVFLYMFPVLVFYYDPL